MADQPESFSIKKLVSGIPNPVTWGKAFAYLTIFSLMFLIGKGILSLFPKPPVTNTSTSVGKVEAGGVSNITNIINPEKETKKVLYVRASTDRYTSGTFYCPTQRLCVEIGAGRSYDGDKTYGEGALRLSI